VEGTSPRLRIRELRGSLTQQTLAERAGIALRTLQKIEGGNPAHTDTLAKIAAALDVSVRELFEEPAA